VTIKQDQFNLFKFSGTDFEIGFQHGSALADEIPRVLKRFRFALENDYGKDWQWFKKFSMENFYDRIEQDSLEEMNGIVEGAKSQGVNLKIEDIVTLNTIAEIDSYFSWIKKKPSDQSCTSFVANGKYTPDGDYILGHTTWWRYYTASSFKFLFVYIPVQGVPYAMQSAPGLLFSFTDFYYNSKGISISETTIDGIKTFSMDGTLLFQRLRKAIKFSKTMEDVVYHLTKGNNGAYSNDYLIGTKEGIGILELGTYNYATIKKREGYIVSSNRVQFDNLYEEVGIEYDSTGDSDTSRLIRLENLMKEGNVSVEKAKSILADHFDISQGKEFPGKNTICGHREIEPRLDKFDKRPPFFTTGSIDGKIVTGKMAEQGKVWVKWGKPCGISFISSDFLLKHPEYKWLDGHLEDIISGPWVEINHSWET